MLDFTRETRLDYVNESDQLSPFMIRLNKLRRFRLELNKFIWNRKRDVYKDFIVWRILMMMDL